MNFCVFVLVIQLLGFSSALITLTEITSDNVDTFLSNNCPPSLILSGPPSDLATRAEEFIGSLIPSIMEELPQLSFYRLANGDQFPELSAVLKLSAVPDEFIFKRNSLVKKFRGKLGRSAFITFIWNNIEDYVIDLSDTNFEKITGVYTWDQQSDWLIQFHAKRAYTKDLFNEVGYRLKGFTNLARVNVTNCPYLEDRFSPLLDNLTLPATLFFRNRTIYIYNGKLIASNFAEYLRDFFYNPKRYHKMMYKTGPTPYHVPAPVRTYYTILDYLVLPEVYNTLLMIIIAIIISAVRIKLKRLEAEGSKKEE
ncbi:hypothetical protein LOD99_9410 [Oopsacas minuta]|uniref:Uncharacterized protein n=1 Tax=Oopsacas minuta TaxID=111878 RepID=A0AAV7JBU6_9METZ|nr:hypothetical protein LOD99_9410 [Oopsacas minuta]